MAKCEIHSCRNVCHTHAFQRKSIHTRAAYELHKLGLLSELCVRTLVSVTLVSVTGRDAFMRAKPYGLCETSCFCLEIDPCLLALLLVQSRVVRELKS